MSCEDDLKGLTEDLGFLNSCEGTAKPRFKNALDLNEFFTTRTAKFEVDGDDMNSFMDDEELLLEENVDTSMDTYLNAKSYADTHSRNRDKRPSFVPLDDISFDSFYDPEQTNNMIPVLPDDTVKKLIVTEGSGVMVPDNCKVYVHYMCIAEGMDEPYDSTVTRGSPTCIDLRNSDVIVGLFLAIKSMRVKEVAKFVIHWEKAFGAVGCPPRIPPSTDIYCIVEVLDIIEEDKLNSIPFMSQDERGALAFKEIYNQAKDLRLEGNGIYKNQGFWRAIKKYRRAADVLEEYPVICAEDESMRQELLYTLYVNLAQCYLKVNRPQQVCTACQLGLRCKDGRQDQSCSKIFYRFAEAKLMLSNTDDALRMCGQALLRDPTNTTILEQKTRILKKKAQEDQMSKAMFTNMGKAFRSSSKSALNGKDQKKEMGVTGAKVESKTEKKETGVNDAKVESKSEKKDSKTEQADPNVKKPVPVNDESKKTEVVGSTEKEEIPIDWEEFQESMENCPEP